MLKIFIPKNINIITYLRDYSNLFIHVTYKHLVSTLPILWATIWLLKTVEDVFVLRVDPTREIQPNCCVSKSFWMIPLCIYATDSIHNLVNVFSFCIWHFRTLKKLILVYNYVIHLHGSRAKRNVLREVSFCIFILFSPCSFQSLFLKGLFFFFLLSFIAF